MTNVPSAPPVAKILSSNVNFILVREQLNILKLVHVPPPESKNGIWMLYKWPFWLPKNKTKSDLASETHVNGASWGGIISRIKSDLDISWRAPVSVTAYVDWRSFVSATERYSVFFWTHSFVRCPVASSHSYTAPSFPHDAMNLSSLDHARLKISPWWPYKSLSVWNVNHLN